nr:hypothetical protein [Burkholderia multivorans]
MNDQQHSSADALTEAQRKALETAVNVLNINWEHETANELWEAFTAPVSQPAAAPIDTPTDREFALSAAICVHPKGVYGDEGGSMCCPITHTRDASFAPPPADERAAFEDAFRAAHEFPEHADQLTFRKGWESAIMWQRRARAASANETEAEVAQWQSRLKDRSSPVVDHWVNISPDGAKTLMEKYADVYEVRALYTAPRSPAVAAEPVAWRSWKDGDGYGFWDTRDEAELASAHDFEPEPLYTAPPAAGEARLTDEQKATINWAIRAAVEAGYTADADVLRALLQGANHE